ncbi:MAG: diacylglycerol kinase family protein [Bacteroidales bacterium]|nr:diacylglycerol kinase family protein [Bacteroidales bacterium]
MVRKRILFVINPIAGKGKYSETLSLIQTQLSNKYEVDILEWSDASMKLTQQIVNQLQLKPYHYLLVAGGDGTVNQSAQALINRNEVMAILPIGSGNGLARHLKIPMNIAKALHVLDEGKVVEIDAICWDGGIAFCSSGIGYDAHVAHLFAHAGKRGLFTYVKMVLRSFFEYKSKQYSINCNGNTKVVNAFFITIANANQWGNNVRVAPKASVTDGLLNVIVLLTFKWYQIPALCVRLFTSTFHRSKNVIELKTEKCSISSHGIEEIEGHYDGEPTIFRLPMNFSCIPKCVKVLVPQKSEI